MKYTLLDLTQTILSSMDSDEINSISDTPEALQVVKIIRSTYFDLITRAKLPENFDLFSLDASGDTTKPVLMYVPEGFQSVEWIKYNVETTDDTVDNMQTLTYLTKKQFVDRMHRLDETDIDVDTFTQTIGGSQIKFYFNNDKQPQYYTSFDDNMIVFDSYDSDVDATLQKSKTLAYGMKDITWENEDDFTPDLDDSQFPLLLNEAKALAWTELRQATHPKAELNARRGWTSLTKTKRTVKGLSDFDLLPNFGRK